MNKSVFLLATIMKHNSKVLLALLAIGLFIVSCTEDNDADFIITDDLESNVVRNPNDLNIFSYETEITNPEMLNAIEYALGLWENYLDSEVAIKVKIKVVPNLPAFGQSIPNVVQNFPDAPIQDVWYPTALANHLVGNRLNDNEIDMDIWLNPSDNWSYEIEGELGEGELDFVALFMHEVCHSLGFGSSAKVEEDRGSFGLVTQDDFVETLSFPISDLQGKPLIFSTLLDYDINGWSLLDTNKFPNDSNALFQAFVSDEVFLSNPLNHGAYDFPKIFAKDSFLFGSSLSHLDEESYPEGSGNALMTPFIETGGKVEREPGQIVLRTLREMGWSIN